MPILIFLRVTCEDKMLFMDDPFLKIMKTIFWHFHFFKKHAHNCLLQNSNVLLLTSKINTNLKKMKIENVFIK